MKRSIVIAVATIAACSTAALAQPAIDGAVINDRIFNDDPLSNFTSVNSYPTQVVLSDDPSGNVPAFANLHNWRASADGGATAANFENDDSFKLFADVTISGAGEGEGGLNLSPWFSQNVDGRFNMRTTDGEVAVFGGRLPFYSFTADQGVTYTKGTTVRLGMMYEANSLTMADPATIEYTYDDGVNLFTSGPLAFDQGNPAEDPPYGLWGMLNDAQIGGYMQIFLADGAELSTSFENINYVPASGSLALLGLAGLSAMRRRR